MVWKVRRRDKGEGVCFGVVTIIEEKDGQRKVKRSGKGEGGVGFWCRDDKLRGEE